MSEVVKPGEVNQEEVNRFTKVFAPILEDGKPSVGRIMLVSTFFLADFSVKRLPLSAS